MWTVRHCHRVTKIKDNDNNDWSHSISTYIRSWLRDAPIHICKITVGPNLPLVVVNIKNSRTRRTYTVTFFLLSPPLWRISHPLLSPFLLRFYPKLRVYDLSPLVWILVVRFPSCSGVSPEPPYSVCLPTNTGTLQSKGSCEYSDDTGGLVETRYLDVVVINNLLLI